MKRLSFALLAGALLALVTPVESQCPPPPPSGGGGGGGGSSGTPGYSGPAAPSPTGPSSPGPANPSGPSSPRGPGGSPNGPSSGGPGAPGGLPNGPASGGGVPYPGITTPAGGGESVDPNRWQTWWEYNRDAYLPIHQLLAGRDRSSGEAGDRTGLSREKIRAEVLPALQLVLRDGGDPALVRNALFALARSGEENGLGLDHYAEFHLEKGSVQTEEAAVLALGIEGKASSVPLLVHVLRNDEVGRKRTCSAESVSVRTRAFAALALGLIVSQSDDEELRLEVVHALVDALGNERTATREIQVASVLAAGLVPLEYCGNDPARQARHLMEGDRHMCGGIQLVYLISVLRDTELDPWVRAHVAPAIGRLGRTAPPELQARVIGALLDTAAAEVPDFVHHSCTIALGLVADGDEDPHDVAARDELGKELKRGDAMTQRLAMISLAKAAGREGEGDNEGKALDKARNLLLNQLSRARGDKKSWAALALGVLGHERMEEKELVSPLVPQALRKTMSRSRNASEAAACALGIGIVRDSPSSEAVIASFLKNADDEFRSYASLTLGLLSAREATEALRAAAAGGVLTEAAVALRLLGDRELAPALVERLEECEDVEERTALAASLGQLDDPSSANALIALVRDVDEEDAVRAAAIDSLGRMCSAKKGAWTAAYSTDVNYNLLTWTLKSPFADGTGLLDRR